MEDTNSQHSKKHDQAVIMLVAFNSVVSGTIAFGSVAHASKCICYSGRFGGSV